jgi:hypothetical protein
VSPSARGQALDQVVLFKFLVDTIYGPKSLSTLLNPSNLPAIDKWLNEVRNYNVQVKRLVSGPGKLLEWARALTKGLDTWVFGERVKHVAVLPECVAGADGVLATFDDTGNFTIVTFACAWYEYGITAAKVAKQRRIVDIELQFDNGTTSRSSALKATKAAFLELTKNWNWRGVFVELPRRKGSPPADQVDDGFYVIDHRNADDILGIPKHLYTQNN